MEVINNMSSVELFMERQRYLDEMIDFCETNSMIHFCDLVLYASKNNIEWFKILCSNGGCKYMVNYFRRINHYHCF